MESLGGTETDFSSFGFAASIHLTLALRHPLRALLQRSLCPGGLYPLLCQKSRGLVLGCSRSWASGFNVDYLYKVVRSQDVLRLVEPLKWSSNSKPRIHEAWNIR